MPRDIESTRHAIPLLALSATETVVHSAEIRPHHYALIGWPLAYSLSPALFAAAAEAAALPHDYQLRPTSGAELAAVVDLLRTGELDGANVTVPHKIAVRSLVDVESDLASAVGAINTIRRNASGQLVGDNTDVAGFKALLHRAGLGAAGQTRPGSTSDAGGRAHGDATAVILGAGGGARAAAFALLSAGFGVHILSRHSGPAGTTAALLYRAFPGAMISSGLLTPSAVERSAQGAAILVNATPVGGVADVEASLWPPTAAWPGQLTVLDLVAWPIETALVSGARAAGCRAFGGLEMLVAQAAASFRWWTGVDADEDAMRSAALRTAALQAEHARTGPRASGQR